MKLEKNGTLILPNFPIESYSHIQIVASNLISNITEIFALPQSPLPHKDLTLKSQMKKDSFYSINRGTSTINKGTKYQVKDLTSTEIQIVDSISKLLPLQKILLQSRGQDNQNGGYGFWSFLKDWGSYSNDDKLKKYDKFASHELNIFIFFKDREFFNKVVKPFIFNKVEKSIVDYALLGDTNKILEAIMPQRLEQIVSQLELALIIYHLQQTKPELARSLAFKLENQQKVNKIS